MCQMTLKTRFEKLALKKYARVMNENWHTNAAEQNTVECPRSILLNLWPATSLHIYVNMDDHTSFLFQVQAPLNSVDF